MFREEIKKIPMDRKSLRNFGLLMALVLLLAGGWLWWKGVSSWPWAAGAAALLAGCGLAVPEVLKPV